MKREFITGLLPELDKDILDKIMAEHGKSVEATKAKFSDYDTIKQQLTDANTAIDGFKAMDIAGIQKAAEDWKKQYEDAERNHTEQLANLEFDSLLSGAVSEAKGKNAKAIRALLDVDTLKASKNQATDMQAALAELKKENDYLFESDQVPPPYATGTGKDPIQTQFSPEENAIRAAAGLKAE